MNKKIKREQRVSKRDGHLGLGDSKRRSKAKVRRLRALKRFLVLMRGGKEIQTWPEEAALSLTKQRRSGRVICYSGVGHV